MRALWVLPIAALLATTTMAGCISGSAEIAPRVRDIEMWVEEQDWEIHPNVVTKAWTFCARGDGVEPVGDGPCGVPGPTIRVTEGDTVRLTFRNGHHIPHTVHFHGWHPSDADMNGNGLIDDAMVAKPGEVLTIEWTAQPAGSYIYHCHFDTPTHMEKGMYGAYIVEEKGAAKPDAEYVAVLDEWQVRDEPMMLGNMPAYNYFTINGHSFPDTAPWTAQPGDHLRVHMVNAGYEFHAMHLHGYTPDSWEGVAGPEHAVPTDVREIAPGQSVVLDFHADREGVWLFHDHVVPRVTAASDGNGFGIYPRGMLTVLAVGDEAIEAALGVAGTVQEAAEDDVTAPQAAPAEDGVVVAMRDYVFATEVLDVDAGTTVTWVNFDPAPHTVTFDDGSVDSGSIAAGANFAYTFDEPGTYTYHCTPHAFKDGDAWKGMTATVIVT